MANYILRRILMLFPTLIGITFVSFLILQFVPGDPASFAAGQDADEETINTVRKELGLDRPIPIQYWFFLKNVIKGDLGRSMVNRSKVIEDIWPHFLNTVKLALVSIIVAFIFGILLGTLAAVYQNSWVDHITMGVVFLGISTPTFWSGLIIILIFSVQLGWFPSGGSEGFHSIVLPALTLAAPSVAMAARMTRSSMLEVLKQDYIKTARAKGQKEWKVIFKHALKNALIPTVTIIGLQFGYLMGGAVLVETIFTWPGLGRLIVSSISGRDYPMVQGGVLLFAFSFVLVNLLIDVIYTYLDPRITYE